jgi:predicted NBD/HSP70 family sugar kinase
MKLLVVDIGGTHVKLWKSGEAAKQKFRSSRKLTPARLVEEVKGLTADWTFDRISIGFPGEVEHGHAVKEPWNLGNGWLGFDFAGAFGVPVRMMNDACMQALGSYEGGKMFYLGLGTSVGTTFIIDRVVVPLALGHLELVAGESFEQCLCRRGLRLYGKKRWRAAVAKAATTLKAALLADYVVLGGGNADQIKELPEGCRRGGNHNAYFGGLRMWEDLPDESESVAPANPPEDIIALKPRLAN